MRAAGIELSGGPVVDVQLPAPSAVRADEVRIEVRAAGVGNWDELMRVGVWPSGLQTPCALGVEVAGVVVDRGGDVPESMLGAEVMAFGFPFRAGGGWAEQFVARAADVAPKPASLDWTAAAVIPVPILTASQAVNGLPIDDGSRVLVHGAGGVTGGLIVQLAVARGARVVATSGPASAARVLSYGSGHVDRSAADWPRQVCAQLAGPPDVAINASPGAAMDALALVAHPGRLASIAGPAPAGSLDIVVRADGQLLESCSEQFGRGELAIPRFESYPLSSAAVALQRAHHGAGGAAVVLTL